MGGGWSTQRGLVEQKTHQKVTARHWPELLISSLREAAQCPLKRLRMKTLSRSRRWQGACQGCGIVPLQRVWWEVRVLAVKLKNSGLCRAEVLGEETDQRAGILDSGERW